MQKKKILNQKISYKNKKKYLAPIKLNNFKFAKKLFSFRKALKYKPYGRKPFDKIGKSCVFSHRLNILVTPNNIFCSLSKNNKNTILSCSSGKYKIKTSKKKLKHTFNLILNNFFTEIKQKTILKGCLITLTSPIKLRKKIINLVVLNCKKIPLLLKVHKKKVFNGCRPAKKIRKKRRGLRILK